VHLKARQEKERKIGKEKREEEERKGKEGECERPSVKSSSLQSCLTAGILQQECLYISEAHQVGQKFIRGRGEELLSDNRWKTDWQSEAKSKWEKEGEKWRKRQRDVTKWREWEREGEKWRERQREEGKWRERQREVEK
jgi:hypothetical protein